MIEVKNLRKVYHPKKGVKVVALDNINLKFEDTGLVFILGKSGSGKSTLLNLLGGLDSFDEGEIIIRGKSSENFSQSDFDSYRNTFIGFVFQEYNILNDFTVGANIALAMQLQGHKSTNEKLNEILAEVDMTGYAGRKPNELSGGQKQRVAIARALIKNPHIIMADEPTGALDSNTGKQVFDTLKELSKDKLVIVVSHDRDFAEQYGDRVIELADGNVISDIKKYIAKSKNISNGINIVDDKIIHIKPGYQLSENDFKLINNYLEQNKTSDSFISLDKKTNTEIKKFARIDESGNKESFADTSEDNLNIKEYDPSQFKLIKSKLPLSNSLKMAAGSLKKKPFRLFMTILLSMVAFVLFGLSHTMISYEKVRSNVDSIIDSKIDYLSIIKNKKVEMDEDYSYFTSDNLTDKDVDDIKKNLPERTFFTVYLPEQLNGGISFGMNLYDTEEIGESHYSYYTTNYAGVATLKQTDVEKLDYTLDGKMPEKDNEIVITQYAVETFVKTGYVEDRKNEKITINQNSDMIGKKLNLDLGLGFQDYTITGVIDTNFDSVRYEKFKDKLNENTISDYILASELMDVTQFSYHSILFVSEDNYQTIIDKTNTLGVYSNDYDINLFMEKDDSYHVFEMHSKSNIVENEKKDIILLNDNKDIENLLLEKGEIIVPISFLQYDYQLYEEILSAENNEEIAEILNKNADKITSKTPELIIWGSGTGWNEESYFQKIVGVKIELDSYDNAIMVSDEIFNDLGINIDDKYKMILSDMPTDREDITKIVKYVENSNDGTMKYLLMNSVSNIIVNVNSVIKSASNVTLIVGIVFAVFASIMLMNFIATSINNRRREIGILRAVGARGTDVFMIFFYESLMIALINWIISVFATGILVSYINSKIRGEYKLLVTILHFGILQMVVMLLISVGVALVASFLPIYRVSRKKPIEAIRKS